MGMWYADERVAAKPYDDRELTVICVVNWTENEQDWKCTIHINYYTIFVIYAENEIHIFLLSRIGLLGFIKDRVTKGFKDRTAKGLKDRDLVKDLKDEG